ncbi:RnfABCDGE type electron transport complex subunit D [Luteolibacter flavescens]|uniref:RnfABCDGE type electron transport complex subunit D n=1 Tax=Luteolibacter flavescens TaxID=1859460 RepID=A0ABT3FMY0_9BACT|nr:RnfABCDGE type electron transport complex subunit D [Luteolibacter flavescens]MCW1884927.1 RnfABCDGE type electron transport complex subunit D [Luteolibacter flavescens]
MSRSRSPHLKPRFHTVQVVMLDVILALLPLLAAAWWAYGSVVLWQVGTAIAAAWVTELLFSTLLLRRPASILDGSAVITSLLLVFTLSPATPLPVVAFGSAAAILFGKLVFGGLGKNVFNPALVGREFMSVFFASVMTSPDIWKTADLVQRSTRDLFPHIEPSGVDGYLASLVFRPGGAVGECSLACIALGGLYLLLRHRISWHIPLALLGTFMALVWLGDMSAPENAIRYSMAGILLGTIFMATDMPSSPTTPAGKAYYGAMMGGAMFVMVKGGIRHEYVSFAILTLNAFARPISLAFRPRTWGEPADWRARAAEILPLTGMIALAVLAVITMDRMGMIPWLVCGYILYTACHFRLIAGKQVGNPV